ncbi:hypothetical protein IFM89_008789 [Coptis chinensis]|uniref:eRF1/Pelota-like N-terminal domain-containing protein n=1 Tax=Coptis chinensis TaxID=261450 RepID=A0A835GVX6_9MAGN|nr:hypothetical protein IFM89_008789 [Coptis chinensis]
MSDAHETDKNIEIWKIKKLIKALEAARGNGTSMISLIMPPRDQIARVTKMLGDEFGTASNIKSRVNRQSVLGAITSAQQRLKLYNKVPPNGLVLYTGTILTDDGKEKKPAQCPGLILAGSADFKTELSQSDMFDPRLQAIILNVVDVSYGGENGFNQAIELSAEILSNVKFVQEKRLIGKYFEEISQDIGKYVFGIDDTLKALEMGAVEILIEANQSNFRDSDTSADLEVQEKTSLLEWFANEYRKFGCSLEFVTNKSQEGSQFCRGFGGIGVPVEREESCTAEAQGRAACAAREVLPEQFEEELIRSSVLRMGLSISHGKMFMSEDQECLPCAQGR